MGFRGKPIDCQTLPGKDLESQQTFDEPGLNFEFAIKPPEFPVVSGSVVIIIQHL